MYNIFLFLCLIVLTPLQPVHVTSRRYRTTWARCCQTLHRYIYMNLDLIQTLPHSSPSRPLFLTKVPVRHLCFSP
ncbi:hypothetical protein B0J17DRAFT_644943 [Rhizoctonia solani]|nr:hypothetical protein B0J17DRAFT_644943 [Rhizoctonia solani]